MSCKNLIVAVILVILFAACSSKPKVEPRRYDLEGKIVFPPPEFKDIDEFILKVSDAGNLLDRWIEET